MEDTEYNLHEDRITELLKAKSVAEKDITTILKAIPPVLPDSDRARKFASRYSECSTFFEFLSALKTLESVKIAIKGSRGYTFESTFILRVFERMFVKFKTTEAQQLFRLYQTFSGLDGGDFQIASQRITRILRKHAFNNQNKKENRVPGRELKELSGNILKIAIAGRDDKKG